MKIKASELARKLKADFSGRDTEIFRAAPADKAGKGDISFIDSEKKRHLLEKCEGAAFIVPENSGVSSDKNAVIFSKNPKSDFAFFLRMTEREKKNFIAGISGRAEVSENARIAKSAFIGPFAVIEKDAEIGENTFIGAGVYVGAKTRIGDNCRIYPNVCIMEECEIGDDVTIHSSSVIGSDGYGYVRGKSEYEKVPQVGKVKICDKVEIGANCSVDRAALEETVIGEGTKLDNNVHIAHNVRIGKNCLVMAQAGIAGSSVIKDNAIIGGQAGLSDHIVIGENAIVMAKTGVMSDIKENEIVFGHFAKPRTRALKEEIMISKLPEMRKTLNAIRKKLGL